MLNYPVKWNLSGCFGILYEEYKKEGEAMSYRKRKKKRGIPRGYIYITMALLAMVILVGGILFVKKYAPIKEHMDLADYFSKTYEDEAAVILNGEYKEGTEDTGHGYAIIKDGVPYLELGFVKDYLDD